MERVTPAGIPKYLKITTIEDSPTRRGTAFMTGHMFLLDDMRPYVFKTTDYGRSWTAIANGLPVDEIARSIREDRVRPGLLFLGTERGVWASFDDGLSWQKLQRNLPATQVADLAVTDHDLVIGTHGRSFWVLDNIDLLRQLDRSGRRPAVRLFKPAPAVRDVDPGVMIDYYLPRAPRTLTLDIRDPSGRLVRSFTGSKSEEKTSTEGTDADDEEEDKPTPKPSMKAGLNRYTWDMRHPGFTEFRGMIMWAASNQGPLVLPGTYQARLTVDGRVQTQPFDVGLDPRVKGVARADLEKRFALAMQVRDKVSRANDAVLLVRGVRAQIADRLKRALDAATRAAAEQLDRQLAAIEGRIYQVRNRSSQDPLNYPIMLNNKLAALAGVVESAEAAPTRQDYAVFAELSQQLDRELAGLAAILDRDLPALNARLRQARLAPVERRSEPAVEQGTGAKHDSADEDER